MSPADVALELTAMVGLLGGAAAVSWRVIAPGLVIAILVLFGGGQGR